MSQPAKAPIAIVLGGTRPHVALIENLKARGFYTVLVDYHENPPASAVADRHIRESTLDQDAVLAIARKMNARLAISACVDQANVTAAYVAEELGLPAPYSYQTALSTSRKPLMKAIMRDHGIPTSPFQVLTRMEDLTHLDLPYPLVVKPADSNGSKGVRRVDNWEQLTSAFREALTISRCGEVIVEGFCKGTDIAADCFVESGVAKVLAIRKKYDLPATSATVINNYASLGPAPISHSVQQKIERIAASVAKAFGLQTTALLIQMMVDNDDVSVIELAPRIGGGLNYRTVLIGTGFDILDGAISSYLGEPVSTESVLQGEVILTTHVFARPGRFREIRGCRDLLKQGTINEFFQLKTEGMIIGPSLSSADRVCSLIIRARTVSEALEKNEKAMSSLVVLDDLGQDIMRHDIYLRQEDV